MYACDRDDVRSYRVERAGATGGLPAAGVGPAPEMNVRGDGLRDEGRAVTWSVPVGWNAVAAAEPMRVATFAAGGVEVSVAAFPGLAGGALANINRWRGQIGLEPVGDADVGTMLVTSREGPTEVSLLSMIGADGRVMLAAIVAPGDGQTWFVKATADPAKAQEIRGSFEAFAKSFRLDTMGRAGPGTAGESRAGIEDQLSRQPVPSNWTVEDMAGGILAAAFTATNEDGGARITATSLLNDGGGLLANVNRWREQLGLGSVGAVDGAIFGAVGPGTTLVSLTNAAGTDHMIVAMAASGQATWFFKIRGTPAGVEREREAFEAYVRALVTGAGR